METFFNIALYVSLAIFAVGLAYRLWTWFRLEIGPEAADITLSSRIISTLIGLFALVFSPRLFTLIRAFILDVILQIQILRADLVRWLMHVLIFGGFMMLLGMHALESVITVKLFPDYASTVNPYLFLRNLFGIMVMAGLAIAVYRRRAVKDLRHTTRPMDRYAIIILAVIMFSGFLLEASKIISYPVFDRMVEDFAGLDDPEEILPLKSYWAKHFDVVFPEQEPPMDEETLALGLELHQDNCEACHSRPASALVSYPLSKLLRPIGLFLASVRADRLLWFLHIGACFIGLAYLPFSKMFHIITSPIRIMLGPAVDYSRTDSARKVTMRAFELDACTHCGNCTLHCSVMPVYRRLANSSILPSEKMISVKALASGKHLEPNELLAIQEGSFTCTGCGRCTRVCPVGINLQDLWSAARKDLAAQGRPSPQRWARETGAAKSRALTEDRITPITPPADSIRKELNLTHGAETFSACFKCMTCTSVCPVVLLSDDPVAEIDLAPHQIMHALGMGLKDMALSARMIWDCLTCYNCQEHCPQGVKVTEVIYELKNIAYFQFRDEEARAPLDENAHGPTRDVEEVAP